MNKSDFYLTLLSNSSMNYFPNNKTTHFSTQLQRAVHLNEEWSVALVELQYPCTLLSVHKQNCIMYTRQKTKKGIVTKPRKIESGNYDSIDDLISELNSQPYTIDKIVFSLNHATKRVSVDFKTPDIIGLNLSNKLALQLGFEPNTDLFEKRTGAHPANILHGITPQLFVYCDIVEPQVVGDTVAKLLRIISVEKDKYVYGSHKMVTFSQLHYMPVLKREFETLEIDIRTDSGEPVPFEFGTVCVKLHFRKSSLI